MILYEDLQTLFLAYEESRLAIKVSQTSAYSTTIFKFKWNSLSPSYPLLLLNNGKQRLLTHSHLLLLPVYPLKHNVTSLKVTGLMNMHSAPMHAHVLQSNSAHTFNVRVDRDLIHSNHVNVSHSGNGDLSGNTHSMKIVHLLDSKMIQMLLEIFSTSSETS